MDNIEHFSDKAYRIITFCECLSGNFLTKCLKTNRLWLRSGKLSLILSRIERMTVCRRNYDKNIILDIVFQSKKRKSA